MRREAFLGSEATDRLLGHVTAMALELYVVRARALRLERALLDAGVLAPGQLDALDDRLAEELAADAERFAAAVLEPLCVLDRSAAEHVRLFGDEPPDPVHAPGGGAHLPS